jgi:hypothetical protein
MVCLIFIICALVDKFFLFIDFIYFITKHFCVVAGMNFMFVPCNGVKKYRQAFLTSLPKMNFTFVPSNIVKNCQQVANVSRDGWWELVL